MAMSTWNCTVLEKFILLGLTSDLNMQMPLFVVFLVIYVISVMGNVFIIIISTISPRLHKPMYFFLSNLSFLDIWYTSSVIPVMLQNFLSLKKSISFFACFTQMFTHLCLGSTECYLLLAMAYDRYVAICRPLRYTIIMHPGLCIKMAGGSWIGGVINSLINTLFALRLSFCGPIVIDHFFCEVITVLQLSCTDASFNKTVIFFCAILVIMGPFFLILITYGYIVSSILKISKSVGRKKAFSTCASHLTVVTLFFGTATSMYMRPEKTHVAHQDKIAALFYSIVTPVLNPLIYTLRNKEVKGAILGIKIKVV